MDQDKVIQLLVEKYNEIKHSEYEIVRYPDKENSATRDVDAYATAPGERPLAIEHTNIESFSDSLPTIIALPSSTESLRPISKTPSISN